MFLEEITFVLCQNPSGIALELDDGFNEAGVFLQHQMVLTPLECLLYKVARVMES